MRDSVLNTIAIPALGSPNPAFVFQAGAEPMRVYIDNIGGTTVFLAHESSNLPATGAAALGGGVFKLGAGKNIVIVLAPKQSIQGVALGGGGEIAYAGSEAIPVKHWMES